MKVYVVWLDPDPGYSASRLLGVFSTREAAEARYLEIESVIDAGVVEMTLDEAADEKLTT